MADFLQEIDHDLEVFLAQGIDFDQKMAQFGTKNLSAYLRKMAVDGYVVQLDLPELKELVSLLRRSSNNLNQLTRKVHETGRIYDVDLEDIRATAGNHDGAGFSAVAR